MAIEITASNVEDTLKSDQLVVLDFWAGWCGPCKMIAPIIDELSNDYAGKVIFGKVDTEDENNDDLVSDYGIRNLPTVLFLKDGKVVDKMVGAAKKTDFQAKIDSLIE